MPKSPNLSVGRVCELCGVDITTKRADARFCSRKHKTKVTDMRRNYAEEYRKDAVHKRAMSLFYYYKNIKKNRAAQLARQKANPEIAAANSAKYRAAKMQRTPAWLTKENLVAIREIYKIAAKKTKESGFSWHVDHIVPLQAKLASGLHVLSNLQVITAFDNISKNNKFKAI